MQEQQHYESDPSQADRKDVKDTLIFLAAGMLGAGALYASVKTENSTVDLISCGVIAVSSSIITRHLIHVKQEFGWR